MTPSIPPLAHPALDRDGYRRTDPELLPRLRDDPATEVLVVHRDRARVTPRPSPRLRRARVDEVPDDARWAFLGRRADGGRALLLAALPPETTPDEDGAPWSSLRAVGGTLDAEDAGALVAGVSLGRWLWEADFCPACGARAVLQQAGWARRCPQCGREHFPRTDPAMIVAVEDGDGERLLLGSNVLWGAGRFSCFAGFVEAGESVEAAVARELAEETGVRTTAMQYRGSQAWPYPRSLMLGFRATVADTPAAHADGREIAAVRWFTRPEITAALETGDWDTPRPPGDVLLPGAASIAHHLIVDWCRTPR